jgi:hypothetical protein
MLIRIIVRIGHLHISIFDLNDYFRAAYKNSCGKQDETK